ncbi:MAG: sulfate adenylyltransferase subunit CysN [Rhodothalassiaceae bacterium]
MHEPLPGAAAADVTAYLRDQERKDLLRFITCGSVDDGKSTLIGRLLYDSKLIFEDQLAALEADSRKAGTAGKAIDFALLLDGLEAEREQGITIDVAYRFFATDKRRFIVADTPGHEQYTRNMATGASTADLAVILVDARKGVLTQTRRHSYICSLLGIRQVVLAVNKMDLVDFSESVFADIRAEYEAFARSIGYDAVTCIPLSALEGDNVMTRSERMAWHDGPSLLEALETAEAGDEDVEGPFRFPVQWVNRPNQHFRGFAGTIAGGRVAVGDEIVVLPSGRTSRIAEIVTFDGDRESARAGEAVTLRLADEIDVSRGDLICHADDRAGLSDQFESKIVWMSDEPLMPGRPYLFKGAAGTATMLVTRLKYAVNVNTLEHVAAKTLDLNGIGVANLSLDRQIAFDPYAANRHTGSFIIIDKLTNATVGAGMIDFGLRRATNIHWQAMDVDKTARAALKGQKPAVLWFTGLSGSGKSTIANLVEKQLHAMGRHTYMLDGDNVRHGLNKDLGFTEEDRVENIRRVAEVAKLMADAGLIVLVSFISPFRSERRMARELMPEGEFCEVFVDTPLEICEQRDPKGLYKKAREGAIRNFTGIDSPYEPPENAEVVLKTAELSPEESAERIVEFLARRMA